LADRSDAGDGEVRGVMVHWREYLGWDEEVEQLETRVKERFGSSAVHEAVARAQRGAPIVALENRDGTTRGAFRKGYTAAIKAELRRLLTTH
jgi:hypothetical protein